MEYHVTGVNVNGRRFKCMRFKSKLHASMINLYRGSVWEVDESGKRKLLWRVYN